MANILLQGEKSTQYKPIDKNWVTLFVKRRPEIEARFKTRMQYGILDEDIFNFDETGFAMGVIATTKVVTRSNMPGKPHLIQPGNREWTTIECINSSGWSIPTCVIFKGKLHIEDSYEECSIPGDWKIKVSANGWTTDEISLE
ncbi:Transposase [Aspergillus affinis]|uniref:Transposase n=1 Tax=Aspergillus affinis TaxID=1070780 RepID=UPI0022FEFD64|nr:Transposase [Aspergillus affinis]KAI9041725.1 Transposase [Aspergillus affinis]